jgi:ADP-ribose pyrophosphatase YjhB (NUDIX family)
MKQTGPRHPIQLSILEALRVAPEGLRYARMKPEGIENDLYNYHLQYLIKQGLVGKQSGRYSLTISGKKYLVDLSPLDGTGEANRFKLASLCILTKNTPKGMQLLYQQRLRQPFVGEWGLIGGGIKRGEPATQAASRRLREEAGLIGEFRLLGVMRKIKFDTQGELYSDILFHACLSTSYSGRLVRQNRYGTQQWVTLEQAIHLEQTQATGSKQLAAILRQLKTQDISQTALFYLEEFYHTDIY